MVTRNSDSGTDFSHRAGDSESLDVKNMSEEVARRFLDADTVKRYYERCAANGATEPSQAETAASTVPEDMSQEQKLENLQTLVNKAVERSGGDNRLSETLNRLSLLKKILCNKTTRPKGNHSGKI